MSGTTSGGQASKPPSKSYWKGKAKATSDDFTDLNPTITYRHLLSSNLGVRDPLRVIALCDSDAFYAACEQVRLNLDPALPLVVQQWDSLIAVNYPARKFGITRMSKVRDALRRCPELVAVHVATYREGASEPGYWKDPDSRTHKVSLDHYRRESMKIIQLFKDGLPSGEVGECSFDLKFMEVHGSLSRLDVEKASIDEAFIDFTKPVREELLKRYPYLATVPPDARNGIDTPLPPPPPISWDGRGNVVPVVPPKETSEEAKEGGSTAVASSSKDPEISDEEPSTSEHEYDDEESPVNEDDQQTTWHDVALSIAAELMMRIREDIRTKLGYTTSAVSAGNSAHQALPLMRYFQGLARNKFLAKVDLFACSEGTHVDQGSRLAYCILSETDEPGQSRTHTASVTGGF